MHIGKLDLFSLPSHLCNRNRGYHNFLIKNVAYFYFDCVRTNEKKGQVSKLGKHFISFRGIIYEVSVKNLRSIKSPLQLQNVDVFSPKWKHMF